jgi:S1-C subfamily serine protease
LKSSGFETIVNRPWHSLTFFGRATLWLVACSVCCYGQSQIGESQTTGQNVRSRDDANQIFYVNDAGVRNELLRAGKRLESAGESINSQGIVAAMAELPSSRPFDALMAANTDGQPVTVQVMKPSLPANYDEAIAPSLAAYSEDVSTGAIANTYDANAVERAFDATLVIGFLYECGNCTRTHVSTAGGILIDSTGLVLTNYHVIENDKPITMVARDRKGNIFPVVEFVAGNAQDDIALVRIAGENFPFVDIAPSSPLPASSVLSISHPKERYFRAAWGNVARYVHESNRSYDRPRRWMEITNPFTRGSSGCGVFDPLGRLVGLISTKIHTSDKSGGEKVTDLTFFRCVPYDSIAELLRLNH